MEINIEAIEERELVKGIRGRFFHTEHNTIGFVEIDKGALLPEHSHFHEQTTELIEGELEFIIDGKSVTLTSGQLVHIPSHVVHSAKAIRFCRVKDTFYPIREDYK